MSSLSGTFSAVGGSEVLLLKPGQQATYTLTEDTATTWTVLVQRSTNPTSTWETIATHSNDNVSSTTVTNDTNLDYHFRLNCTATDGNLDWTLDDVSGEIQQEFLNKQTGRTEISYTDNGVTIERNLQVDGDLSVTGSLTTGSSSVLILPGATVPAQTAEGSVVWDTDNDLLTVGTGSTRKTYLDTNSTQTGITGKTFTSPTLTTPVVNGVTTGSATAENKKYMFTVGAKVGATAGWVIGAATNVGRLATCPASQTGSTLVINLSGIRNIDSIVSFYLLGQIESAGGAVTLDAELRKLTAAAADLTDASVSSMTQISVTADTAINSSNSTKTLASPSVIASDETYYLLLTATTAASTDIDLMGVVLNITEKVFDSGE